MSAGPPTDPAEAEAALRAYERVREKADGRMIEPFEAHRPLWETEAIACLAPTPIDRIPVFVAKGSQNYLMCGYGATSLTGLHVSGHRNSIYIGAFCDVRKATIVITGDDNVVFIGAFTRILEHTVIQAQQSHAVTIGERCHLGERCVIATSDGHGIYLAKGGSRINPERDVVIGDHAFIGYDSRVQKGSVIEPEGIVLERSIVSGLIRANCVYQGIPATLREEGVSWTGGTEAGSLDEAEAEEARTIAERTEFLRGRIAPGGAKAAP